MLLSFDTAIMTKNDFHGKETHFPSSKEKIPGAAVNKKGHANSLPGHYRNYHYWFHWKMRNYKQ